MGLTQNISIIVTLLTPVMNAGPRGNNLLDNESRGAACLLFE